MILCKQPWVSILDLFLMKPVSYNLNEIDVLIRHALSCHYTRGRTVIKAQILPSFNASKFISNHHLFLENGLLLNKMEIANK